MFGSRNLNEPWHLDYSDGTVAEFWNNPRLFLKNYGFIVAGQANTGDILGYRHISTDEFQHWGLYEGNGLVLSKFDLGHIFRHKVDAVPSGYGNEIVCFRRHYT